NAHSRSVAAGDHFRGDGIGMGCRIGHRCPWTRLRATCQGWILPQPLGDSQQIQARRPASFKARLYAHLWRVYDGPRENPSRRRVRWAAGGSSTRQTVRLPLLLAGEKVLTAMSDPARPAIDPATDADLTGRQVGDFQLLRRLG